MRIDSGAVAMASERTYERTEYSNTVISTVSMGDTGHVLDEATGQVREAAAEDVFEPSEQTAGDEKENYMQSLGKSMSDIRDRLEDNRLQMLKTRLAPAGMDINRLDEHNELTLIEQILNAFFGDEEGGPRFKARDSADCLSQQNGAYTGMQSIAAQFASFGGGAQPSGDSGFYFSQSTYLEEVETTSFTAQGVARTADGREISFSVDVSMTRSFMEATHIAGEYRPESRPEDPLARLVDPLVINLGSEAASVSDQHFVFDIDADGTAEEIAQLGSGSGYLALDKNGDGKINDGSELFGARTGDGFAELAQFDDDGNGWIDENDSVFNRLKVWSKDESGADRLVAIAKADVGAIFLGSAGTDFSLTGTTSENASALIRSTGIYLKESGGAGTIQHMDYVV